ncbi:MAG: 3H domain-containing protein [Thermotogota bacterium]
MNSDERRKNIINLFNNEKKAITGNHLADLFGVTRQVIVKDIAILRAEGLEIISTYAGYKLKSNKNIKIIAVKHNKEEIKKELETIVNNGGKVIDITVEHPIYGELTGMLSLESEEDIEIFMAKIINSKPLLIVNDGLHLHRIEVPDEQTFINIKKALDKLGLLVK